MRACVRRAFFSAPPAEAPPAAPSHLSSFSDVPAGSSSEAMACATVACSVTAALAPATQVWEGKNVMSRQGLVLAAPASRSSAKLVANRSRVVMSAQSDNKVAAVTSLALLAAAVVPEIAEAAQPGVSPSLKNLLLSVVAGGVVLSVIGVAVAGVSTFDPVKRK